MRVSEQTDRLASSVVTPDRAVATLTDDVRAGLLSRPRWLPAKYFYDDHGSELFEAICATPEYYPSRAEEALLAAHAGSIVEAASPDHMLELGSGSSRKTRHLLAACDRLGRHPVYWPFDVSAQMMLDAGADLVGRYPWLSVHALIGDYTGGLGRLPLPHSGRRLIVFLGGTLGNFEPAAAIAMLREIAARYPQQDVMIVAHGTFIRLTAGRILGVELPSLQNGEVVEVTTGQLAAAR